MQRIGLITRTDGGRLFVATKDGNQAVEFANYGGSHMVETLSLVDIPENNPAINGERFATLATLQDQIKKNSQATGLSAEVLKRLKDLLLRLTR